VPHCTQADVQIAAGGAERLRQLADWDNSGKPDADVIAAHIAIADAMINSKIEIRHAIPQATVETIRWKSAQMTVFYLKKARGMLAEEDFKTHEIDLAWLDGFKGGNTTMGDPTGVPTASSYVGDAAIARGTDKDVSRSKLGGYT
jgi:phage gp36-like protein